MDVVVERVAGLDVHKRQVTACVRVPGPRGERTEEVRTFSTFTRTLAVMADWLAAEHVTTVVMESTGVFWKPVWHVLEDRVECLLVNARHAHNVPGRKTDVSDASWLARLAECGLLRPSFVPPAWQRDLRDLTRYRRRLVEAHTAESHRLTKVLEDAGIKLDSVACKTLTKSGRAMIGALCAGERDPNVLAEMAMTRMRAKIPELREALVGRFGPHHAVMCRHHLDRVGDLEVAIAGLDAQIQAAMEPVANHRDRLCSIPGVATRTAETIIAEVGVDMERFPTAGHLASWAGMCPGHHESAGKRASGRTRPGDSWLRAALVESAWAVGRGHRDNYLAAQFWHIARKRGQKKAVVAVGHSMLIAAFFVLRDEVEFADLGPDWFNRRLDPERRSRWLVTQLEALGYSVTLS
jgi:transposase